MRRGSIGVMAMAPLAPDGPEIIIDGRRNASLVCTGAAATQHIVPKFRGRSVYEPMLSKNNT